VSGAVMPHGVTDQKAWLRLAERAAREAGELLAGDRASHARATGESPRDVKLTGDIAAEERIVSRLQRESGLAILAEERGNIAARTSSDDLRWIVDPLDGSVNYLRGIPFACVSVGLWDSGQPLLGAVYDFTREEMYTGLVGEGAWLNGAAIRVAETRERSRAVLCTGFPVHTDFTPDVLSAVVEQIREYRKVRMLGSAALSLAYVAAGRADAYVERNIRLWDVAAGAAIVRAAGGKVAWAPAADGQTLIVYASGRHLPPPAGFVMEKDEPSHASA
jgi:myo-inositol-1(or 4)-monophosphatase